MTEPSRHLGPDGDDAAARAVRRALGGQARRIDPGPAPRVRDLPGDVRRRWPSAVAVAAGVAVLLVSSVVALRPDAAPPPVAGPGIRATATATAPPAPDAVRTAPEPTDGTPGADSTAGTPGTAGTAGTAGTGPSDAGGDGTASTPPGGVASAILWYVVEQPAQDRVDLRLVPQRVPLPPGSGGAAGPPEVRVRTAVDRLLGAPSPDPDHANPWWWEGQQRGDAALSVTVAEDGTVVDLPSGAFDGPVGSAFAGAGLGTLVRTVVSNGGTAPVTLLVDGQPGAEVWGAYVLDTPLEPESRSLAGGWVLDPYEGQRVPAGPVTVSGTAGATDGELRWQVTDAAGDVVADGVVPVAPAGGYESFSFTVDLPPGRHQVAVRDPGPTDAGPGPAWEHTTTIEVVP